MAFAQIGGSVCLGQFS